MSWTFKLDRNMHHEIMLIDNVDETKITVYQQYNTHARSSGVGDCSWCLRRDYL
jgi:hypothetical protein